MPSPQIGQFAAIRLPQWLTRAKGLLSSEMEGQVKAISEKGILVQAHCVVRESMTCLNCGREIINPISQLVGYGPICSDRLGIPRPESLDLRTIEALRQRITRETEQEMWLPKERVTFLRVWGTPTATQPPPTPTAPPVSPRVLDHNGSVFVLRFAYDAALVEQVRLLKQYGAEYRPQPRLWVAPSHASQHVALFALHNTFQVTPAAQAVISGASADITASSAVDADLEVEGLGGTLRPFQRAGVAYITSKRRCLVGDEMGLGKTVEALAALKHLHAFPAIVVCPASLKLNWQREARKWLPGHSVSILGSRPSPALLNDFAGLAPLDQQVGFDSRQQGHHVVPVAQHPHPHSPSPSMDPLLVHRTANGQQPVNQVAAGVANLHTTATTTHPDVPLAVHNARQVGQGDRVGGQGQSNAGDVAANASPLGDVGHRPSGDPRTASNMVIGEIGTQQIKNLPLRRLAGSIGMSDILIVNYDILHTWLPILTALMPPAIVFDESHMVKSPKARRTRAADALALACREAHGDKAVVLCLTGTAVLNQPLELIPQLQIMDRLGEFGGRYSFQRKYGEWARQSDLVDLNRRMRGVCYLRREKKEVLTELPPKQRSYVPVDLTNRGEYSRAATDLIAYLRAEALKDAEFNRSLVGLTRADQDTLRRERADSAEVKARRAEHLVRVNKLKRLVARGKLSAVLHWVQDFLDASDEKLVVFGWHQEMVEAIGKHFKCPTITGSTPVALRQAAVDSFQSDPKTRLIAMNLASGGVGLTLTAASNVLSVELGWTPALHDQAEDRCHRIGQTDSVNCWYLLADRTIEAMIYDLIETKRGVVEATLVGNTDDSADSSSVFTDLLDQLRHTAG